MADRNTVSVAARGILKMKRKKQHFAFVTSTLHQLFSKLEAGIHASVNGVTIGDQIVHGMRKSTRSERKTKITTALQHTRST